MNIFFITLTIFVLVYLTLNWFVKTSSAKISKGIRTFTIILSLVLAVLMAFAGRYIFSLPFLLMILPLIKTKAGLTLIQFLRIWGLLRVLRNRRVAMSTLTVLEYVYDAIARRVRILLYLLLWLQRARARAFRRATVLQQPETTRSTVGLGKRERHPLYVPPSQR